MMVVIGCGNLNRGDDGVGVVIARRLSREHGKSNDRVKIFDAGTGGMEIMFEARGADKLIIVDACASGSEPGAIFEAPGGEFENASPPSYTLHGFRWDHALYAGRRIFANAFPRDVTVFLVEAKSLDYGLDLSPEADRAADIVVGKIGALIGAYPNTGGDDRRVRFRLRRDHLYFDTAAYAAHMQGLCSVALLRKGGDLHVAPLVGAGAGGYLIKQVNARGDRAIHAADFFRLNGVDDGRETILEGEWSEATGSFIMSHLFDNV